jgi:hypothetical protein
LSKETYVSIREHKICEHTTPKLVARRANYEADPRSDRFRMNSGKKPIFRLVVHDNNCFRINYHSFSFH